MSFSANRFVLLSRYMQMHSMYSGLLRRMSFTITCRVNPLSRNDCPFSIHLT